MVTWVCSRHWPFLALLVMATACAGATPTSSKETPADEAPASTASPKSDAPEVPPVNPVPEVLPDVVARVNDTAITADELERAVRSAEIQAGQPLPAQFRDQVYRSILDQLVSFHLLLQESEALSLTIGEAELEERIDGMRGNFPDEEAFQAQLANWETTLDAVREETRRDLQVEQVIASQVLPGIDINAETARAFYDEHPEQFTRAGGREARHLLIGVSPNASDNDKTEARTRATELRQQVLDGADFAELAGSQSEDPGSAENGGSIGLVVPGQTVPPFEQALFALKEGETSEVVETPFGFHVIQMTGVQEPQLVSFEETSLEIQQFLETQEQQARTETFLQSLRDKSTIEILI